MTETEYTKEMTRLKRALTVARNKVHTQQTLKDKVGQLNVVREAEHALRQHKLDRFELVIGL